LDKGSVRIAHNWNNGIIGLGKVGVIDYGQEIYLLNKKQGGFLKHGILDMTFWMHFFSSVICQFNLAKLSLAL
jgi:hypothetical protein